MFFVGTHLRLKISMDITELVQLADCSEHLADVEACMFFLENARIVQQCPKVASRHILHRKIDMLGILKRIQKSNKPGCFCRGEDVSFHKHVSDLDGRFLVEKRQRVVKTERCTSSILKSVRLRIFFRAHTSPVSCLRAR